MNEPALDLDVSVGQIYKTLRNRLFGCNRRVKGYWFCGDK